MKNFKLQLIILLIVSIIGIIAFVFSCDIFEGATGSFEGDTGSFYGINFSTGTYCIQINSDELGHPSSDAKIFSTYFEIENKNSEISSYWYNVDYIDIFENNVKEDYPNIDEYQEIIINNKKFKYIINTDKNSIDLIYIKNKNCYLLIKVKLDAAFKKDESSYDGDLVIDENILKSNEIKGIINFTLKRQTNLSD